MRQAVGAVPSALFVAVLCPAVSMAQTAPSDGSTPPRLEAQAAPERPAPRIGRGRLFTSLGLLAGGATLLATAEHDDSLYQDDRRLLQIHGVGAIAAGGLMLALPSRTSPNEPQDAAPPAAQPEEHSRRKMWTGIGLTLGGAVFLVQSVVFFGGGCEDYDESCKGALRAYRTIGGALTASGVTLILLDQAEKRRRTRVALGLAPRAVRVDVSF
jgi:hypothetical protein